MVRDFKEQLAAVSNNLVKENMTKTKTLPANVNTIGEDGETHINLNPRGKTKIGHLLALETLTEIQTPLYGRFSSFLNLYSYLSARVTDDDLRTMNHARIRQHIRAVCKGVRANTPGLKAVVIDCMYRRILDDRRLYSLLKNSSLPFDSYTELPSGLRERSEHARWVCAGYEELRSAIQEERTPNLSIWLAGQVNADTMHESMIELLKTGGEPAREAAESTPVKVEEPRHKFTPEKRPVLKERPPANYISIIDFIWNVIDNGDPESDVDQDEFAEMESFFIDYTKQYGDILVDLNDKNALGNVKATYAAMKKKREQADSARNESADNAQVSEVNEEELSNQEMDEEFEVDETGLEAEQDEEYEEDFDEGDVDSDTSTDLEPANETNIA